MTNARLTFQLDHAVAAVQTASMPKRLSEHTFEDWLHIRPLTQTYKSLLYDVVNELHVRKPARAGDVGAIARGLAGRKVLITLAYEDAQAIEWQLRLMRRYVRHDVYLIADNSFNDASAAAIRAVAEHAGAPYVRLPHNRRRLSHNHGLALNWLWRNLVRPGAPAAFGFLDDDLFPTAADDPFAHLAQQDFYGFARRAGARWFLWAGFCFFRFGAVADKSLDFRPDYFNGLDTGGGNWEVLYRHADLARMRKVPMRTAPYKDGVAIGETYFQWSDGWLHEVGTNDRPLLQADKRAVVAALLAPHLGER